MKGEEERERGRGVKWIPTKAYYCTGVMQPAAMSFSFYSHYVLSISNRFHWKDTQHFYCVDIFSQGTPRRQNMKSIHSRRIMYLFQFVSCVRFLLLLCCHTNREPYFVSNFVMSINSMSSHLAAGSGESPAHNKQNEVLMANNR